MPKNMPIFIPDTDKITKHKSIKSHDDFVLYKNGDFQLNGEKFNFENRWNKNRHTLAVMATICKETRLCDRLN